MPSPRIATIAAIATVMLGFMIAPEVSAGDAERCLLPPDLPPLHGFQRQRKKTLSEFNIRTLEVQSMRGVGTAG
jgi:hypothetical protein